MLKEFGKNALNFIIKHKAQIAIGAGIVGNTAATVIACKQTLTAKKIVEDHKDRRNEIDEAKEICRREIKIYETANGQDKSSKTYQEPCDSERYENFKKYLDHDYKKDLTRTYCKTGFKFMRHYALPAALYLASNIAICIGTGILTKQVTGLTTSLTAVTAAYADYRERVKKAIGEDAERRIFTNEQIEVRKYKDVDDDGNEIEKEETIIKTDGKYDPYAIKLDRCCYQYHNDIQKTLSELKCLESDMNRQLIGRGMVTLNEVYEALGYNKTEAGAQVGWVYCTDPEEQKLHGDGYISFGLFDHVDQNGDATLNPRALTDQWVDILNSHTSIRQNDTDEYDIWLYFNVDGPIIKYMDKVPGNPI